MDRDLPRPSWRKPFGIFVILALITALAGVVAHFAPAIAALPGWLQAPLYLILGLVWITPLKPLLRWMEAGSVTVGTGPDTPDRPARRQ